MDGNAGENITRKFNELMASGTHEKTVTVDLEKYRHHVEGMGLTEDQEREALEAVWMLLVGLMDCGYQIVFPEESCGKAADTDSAPPQADSAALNSFHQERE
ncbi:hypothetical protein [Leisingera caerulea]|uniref:hypothetical protein n=1 Tax=Leisingera caerulea TaxID=506591 RepID=UPI000488930D|nr:hypothetical protein [Leisingera caerulea]